MHAAPRRRSCWSTHLAAAPASRRHCHPGTPVASALSVQASWPEAAPCLAPGRRCPDRHSARNCAVPACRPSLVLKHQAGPVRSLDRRQASACQVPFLMVLARSLPDLHTELADGAAACGIRKGPLHQGVPDFATVIYLREGPPQIKPRNRFYRHCLTATSWIISSDSSGSLKISLLYKAVGTQ